MSSKSKLKLVCSFQTQTCRYLHGVKPEADKQSFLQEGSGSVRVLGLDRNVDSTWNVTPSCFQVDSASNPSYGAQEDFELMNNAAMSRHSVSNTASLAATLVLRNRRVIL
ncbi:hypothetical protein Acr_10g0006170 [Actinidia rufa]|uniref:Uncharacterized protein n=1 Tax=Actinidia rufa TaxID=165716 RepID=A0A7J0F951_9ERIC|nr:hypothetical protein Acr_10g0006170 [Actinidia rufa]